jgi:hypothetical protein
MSSIDPYSPLRLEDFPTQRDWIDTLFLPLNKVLSQVTQALGGQTTFGDNIPTFTKTLSGSSLTLPQSFQFSGSFVPTQMIVAQATKGGVAIPMIGAWSITGDTITVNKLYELTDTVNIPMASGPKYSIVLRFN